MKVVHCKKEKYDIYIGRGKCPVSGRISRWGNPFVIGRDGDRDEVIRKYEEWIRGQRELLDSLIELKGQILGCWCAPKPCHGDVLVKLVEEMC
jgi:hypothetical protein